MGPQRCGEMPADGRATVNCRPWLLQQGVGQSAAPCLMVSCLCANLLAAAACLASAVCRASSWDSSQSRLRDLHNMRLRDEDYHEDR